MVPGALTLLGLPANAQYDPANPWSLPPETVQKGVREAQFQIPDVCARCHPEQYRSWSKSMHQQYTNPAFQWAFEQASKDTKGAVDQFCPRCHSPIAVLGGETMTPGQYSRLSDLARKGVQCDFCHVLDKVSPDWPGNGSFHVSPGLVKRGPLRNAVSPFHKTAYSALHTEADFCGMCHNVSHPGTHLQLENTFTEWKNSDYAKKNITCQSCHMPSAANQAAAVKGPVRPLIHRHTFVGANVRAADPSIAAANLKRAADIKITASDGTVNYGQKLQFNVRVTNKGAGHYLPTGITELREMWWELTLTDADGNVVFTKEQMFNTIMEDASGLHDGTVPIWKAVKVYRDNRIAPHASATVPVDFTVPYSLTVGDLKAKAVLKYRSLPLRFFRQAGLGQDPVTVMAQTEPMTIRVRPSFGAQVLAIAVTGFFGLGYLLPLVVLLAWLALTVWLAILAWRGRAGKAA